MNIIYCCAPRCPACVTMVNILKEIKDVPIEKIDITERPDVARQYAVTGLPTVLVMESNQIIARYEGVGPKTKSRLFAAVNHKSPQIDYNPMYAAL